MNNNGNQQGDNNSADRSTQLLEGAYAIKTAADNIDYYRDFADIYDAEFADSMGYVYPAMLADVFTHFRKKSDDPIADIGCGTGLVADVLQMHDSQADDQQQQIDGIDISQEMLDVAAKKNLYRALYQTDLTQTLEHLPGNYGAVISAGTFTFGHLGPEILPDLLQLGRADTLYCIGVNSVHYEEQGFSRVLNTMEQQNLISAPVKEVKKIYDQQSASDTSHAEDTASIIVYRQL